MTDPSERPPETAADPRAVPADQTHARGDESSVPFATGADSDPRFSAPAFAGEVGMFGRYRVLKKIGEGGMGAVFLGYDGALERKVALKVVLPKYTTNAEARERFLREARSAAKVKSDHVVTIHDVGEEGGVPFIAMEYLLGLPLDQFLKTRGELPLTEVLRIGRETATGLAAAHELGLAHRDIKPGNLWLESPNGRIKLLDFGLARLTKEDVHLTGTGAVMGTPAYMSPEQARGAKVDHRSDLFSLGVMLYRLCTGRMPFTGNDQMSLLTSLAVDTPTPVRQINPQLPPGLEWVIARLLAKNPSERFQSALEVVEAIRGIEQPSLSGTPVIVPIPVLPFVVGAQTQNVWESIDESESVPVPLATPMDTEGQSPSAAEPAPKPTRKRPERKVPKWPLLVAGVIFLLAVTALGFVLFGPANGTLLIMDAEPETELIIKKNGEVVHDRTKDREFSLRTGKYTIEVADVKPGTRIDPEFEITKGGTSRVTVRLPPPKKDDKKDEKKDEKKDDKKDEKELPPIQLYELPKDLIAPKDAMKPAVVLTLDHLNPAKHVPPEERFDWQPRELFAVLGSHRQRFPEAIGNLMVSPDGTVVRANNHAIEVAKWKLLPWPPRIVLESITPKMLAWPGFTAFSPDGKRGAAGNRVWNLEKPQEPPREYLIQGSIIEYLGPDLVLAQVGDGLITWKLDLKEPKQLGKIKVDYYRHAVTRDRKYLAIVSGAGVCTVFAITEDGLKEKYVLPGEEGKVRSTGPHPHCISFSDTGLLMMQDAKSQWTRVWDVTGPEPKLRQTVKEGLPEIVCALPNGEAVIRAGPTGFSLWSITDKVPRKLADYPSFEVAESPCLSVAVTSDGETIITGHVNGSVRFWGFEGTRVSAIKPLFPQPLLNPDLDFSPDGRYAILRHENGNNYLWNIADIESKDGKLPEPKLLTQMEQSVVRFRPDGGEVCANVAGNLRLYSTADLFGKPTQEFAIGAGQIPLRYSPNGKWLASSQGNDLVIWDVTVSPPRRLANTATGLSTRNCRFTPDGRFLIATGGHMTKVWAMTLCGPVIRLENKTDLGEQLAVSSDGKTVAFCVPNQQTRLFDFVEGEIKLRRALDIGGSTWLDFSPDGKALFVGGYQSGLKLVDAGTGKVLHEWTTPRGIPLAGRFHPDGKHLFVTNTDKTTYILRLPSNADRRAAEYVLKIGGTVRLNDQPTDFKTKDQLPPTNWLVLTSVDLTGNAKFDDAGLKQFEGCNNLKLLTMKQTKVSNKAVGDLANTLPQCQFEWADRVIVPKK